MSAARCKGIAFHLRSPTRTCNTASKKGIHLNRYSVHQIKGMLLTGKMHDARRHVEISCLKQACGDEAQYSRTRNSASEAEDEECHQDYEGECHPWSSFVWLWRFRELDRWRCWYWSHGRKLICWIKVFRRAWRLRWWWKSVIPKGIQSTKQEERDIKD